MMRVAISAGVLILLHFLAWAYVVANHVLYDQGGWEGLLWWLVAFLILPALALGTLLVGGIVRWRRHRRVRDI
jgi:ABC-type dipeptide/oligopeptide/nickel transport system permease component